MGMLAACFRAIQPIHFNISKALFWTLWLGMLGLFVLMLFAKAREMRKRREGLAQFAMENGFTFNEAADQTLTEQMAAIQVTGTMGSSWVSNVLQGSAGGGEAVIVDRTTGSGKSRSTSTVVAFKFASAFPTFLLCPENVFWRLSEKLGYSDIDIDGAPDFSARFFLHGENQAAVRALFKPEITKAFEQLDPKIHCYVSGAGPWLAMYRPGRLIPVQELRDFLQYAESLTQVFRRAQPGGSAFR